MAVPTWCSSEGLHERRGNSSPPLSFLWSRSEHCGLCGSCWNPAGLAWGAQVQPAPRSASSYAQRPQFPHTEIPGGSRSFRGAVAGGGGAQPVSIVQSGGGVGSPRGAMSVTGTPGRGCSLPSPGAAPVAEGVAVLRPTGPCAREVGGERRPGPRKRCGASTSAKGVTVGSGWTGGSSSRCLGLSPAAGLERDTGGSRGRAGSMGTQTSSSAHCCTQEASQGTGSAFALAGRIRELF